MNALKHGFKLKLLHGIDLYLFTSDSRKMGLLLSLSSALVAYSPDSILFRLREIEIDNFNLHHASCFSGLSPESAYFKPSTAMELDLSLDKINFVFSEANR